MADEQKPEDQEIVPTDLTPEQAQAWADTMSLMAWTAPGFRHLFYKLLANNNGKYIAVPTEQVPIAATDAKNIFINPEPFFKFGLKERVFVMAHEVVHNVYSDVELLQRCRDSGKVPMSDGTFKDFDEDTMQRAMDYRINAILVASKIGALPKGGLYDPKIATANDSVLDTYGKLYKGKKNPPPGGGGFDKLLPPGNKPGQGAARNNQQWAVEVSQAQKLEQARARGNMPGSLNRMFKDILEPKVPWTDHILAILRRKVGSGSYNWRKPDRRGLLQDLHMPSRSGYGAGWIVVWGDTSGSIGDTEMNNYLAELSGIIEDCKPRRLTVVWCDAAVHQIDELAEPGELERVRFKGIKGGGGGTDVKPVMDWIATHTDPPDVFIGMTDGYVSFPSNAPPYHTIWASLTPQGQVKYPFGDVVYIK